MIDRWTKLTSHLLFTNRSVSEWTLQEKNNNMSSYRWGWSRSGSRAAPRRKPSRWFPPGKTEAAAKDPGCQGCCWLRHRPVHHSPPRMSASRCYWSQWVKASPPQTLDLTPFHSSSVVYLDSNRCFIRGEEFSFIRARQRQHKMNLTLCDTVYPVTVEPRFTVAAVPAAIIPALSESRTFVSVVSTCL